MQRFSFKSSLANEPFLSGNSSNYVEEMYYAWLMDPNSVHKSWNAYFTNLKNNSESKFSINRMFFELKPNSLLF